MKTHLQSKRKLGYTRVDRFIGFKQPSGLYPGFGLVGSTSFLLFFFLFIFFEAESLRQLGGLLVQRLDHVGHILHRIQGALVRLINRSLLEHNQASCTLVQHTVECLVQDHLRQLDLDLLCWQLNNLGNMGNLYTGEGLNHTDQVLFQQFVVQRGKMIPDNGVIA